MIATKKQITYIQKNLGILLGNAKNMSSIYAIRAKMLHTKKICMVGAYLNSKEGGEITLTFACTKLGYKILNEAINLTMASASNDLAVKLLHEQYSVTFITPVEFKESGIAELQKCECIQWRIRAADLGTRTRILNLFNQCAVHFI